MKRNQFCTLVTSILLLLLAAAAPAFAQVKVGSNPTSINSTSNLEVEGSAGGDIVKVAITKDSSKMGIGTAFPTHKLHLKAAPGANPIRIEGLQDGTGSESVLLVDANGVLKKQATAIPIPTVRLIARASANWNAYSNGALLAVPLNTTDTNDGNFNTSTYTYTVPATAVYQISGFWDGTVQSTNGGLDLNAYIVVNGNEIKMDNHNGAWILNTPITVRLTKTIVLKLTAGDTVKLGTVSCNGCTGDTYTGMTQYTNMTIIKIN